ncbi:MAG: hypothetical protein ACXWDO_10130 [Bacteroidia bacterium]
MEEKRQGKTMAVFAKVIFPAFIRFADMNNLYQNKGFLTFGLNRGLFQK